MKGDVLAIFAKAPVPGQVKTRLSPALTPEEAASTYAACIADVVELARSVNRNVVIFHPSEPGAREYFTNTFPGLRLAPQSSGDLGARMRAAIEELLTGPVDRVTIIGADAPTLPPSHLREGLNALRRTDVVIGPARDGGYYLVGVRREAWPRAGALFEGIRWSTEAVLSDTLLRVERAGMTLRLLPEWYDIDRPEDLRRALRDAHDQSRLRQVFSRSPPARVD